MVPFPRCLEVMLGVSVVTVEVSKQLFDVKLAIKANYNLDECIPALTVQSAETIAPTPSIISTTAYLKK